MRPMGEQQPGQKVAESAYAIRQLQRRPAPTAAAASTEIVWAKASAGSTSISHAGNDYRLTFNNGMTNSTDDYDLVDVAGGRASWLQITNPGYYVAQFSVIHSLQPPTTFERFIEPLFDQSGTPSSIQENQGVADFIGSYKTRETLFLSGETQLIGLYSEMTFNWNPDSPVSDLDFEDPLKIGLQVATVSDTTARNIGGEVFVMRIASAGYVDMGP